MDKLSRDENLQERLKAPDCGWDLVVCDEAHKMSANRYGDLPEVRAKLDTAVEYALDQGQLQDLLEEHALAHDAMDASKVQKVREQMERAEARRLQPHFIEDKPLSTLTVHFKCRARFRPVSSICARRLLL